jgi:type IV pilus assembly protein PilV
VLNRNFSFSMPRVSGRGFAMIEVLVTMVILLIGLLGLAGVSARANVMEFESYQRVQALMLVQDMSDRLNANRQVAAFYSNSATGVQLGSSGTGYTGIPTCSPCGAQQTQAIADMTAWEQMLQGSAEVSSGSKVGAMIGAVGCVTRIDAVNNIYLISVAWQGMLSTAAPPGTAPCGTGLYTDEKMHRIVTTTVRIGAIS